MRAKLLIFLVIFSNLSHSLPKAQQVVVASKNANQIQFDAFLGSNSNHIAFSKWLLIQSPQTDNRTKLIELFEKAQVSYFNAPRSQAIAEFKQVLELQNTDIWKDQDAKIFVTAALRAAELSEQEILKNEFLLQAAYWSQNIELNKNTFSPPLVADFENVKNFTTEREINLEGNYKLFDFLVIRNKVFSLKNSNRISVLPGKQRVRIYSSKFISQEKILSPTEINSWNPPAVPVVKGDCNSHKLEKSIDALTSYVFFDKGCVINKNGSPTIASLKPQIDYKKQYKGKNQMPFLKTKVKEKPAWWKNRWVWVAVAGAGAAYMIHENNKSSGSNKNEGPTTVVYE